MVKNDFFPSDDDIDKLFNETEVAEENSSEDESSMENQSTEQDSSEIDTLKAEVTELKKLAEDYKRMVETKVPDPPKENFDDYMNSVGELDEEELEELPPSVRDKIKKIDILEKRYAQMEEQRSKDEVKSKADGFVRDMDSLSKEHPALKDKNVRYATLMYAANGLGDTSKKGFLRAYQDLSKSFGTDAKADVAKKVSAAKKTKESVPKVGKGGMPSLTTDNTPKSLAEATEMANAYLKKL